MGWVEDKQIRRITTLLLSAASSRPTMYGSYTTGKAWENDTGRDLSWLVFIANSTQLSRLGRRGLC